MTLDEAIKAYESRTPVMVRRPNEDTLYFKYIQSLTERVDKDGQPDFLACLVDKGGCLAFVSSRYIEVDDRRKGWWRREKH